MKLFDQIRKRHAFQELELEERFSRASIGASFALQGKRYGDKAEKHFQNALRSLERTSSPSEQQTDQIASAISDLAKGLIEIRKQTGSLTSLALLATSKDERGVRRRRS